MKPPREGPPDEYVEDPQRYFSEWLPLIIEEYPRMRAKMGTAKAVAQIRLDGERGGTWHLVMDDGDITIGAGEHARPSFTFSMSLETWQLMLRREMTLIKALMHRRIRFKGSRLALMRVGRCAKALWTVAQRRDAEAAARAEAEAVRAEAEAARAER